jgi:MSHA pilin protein MshD
MSAPGGKSARRSDSVLPDRRAQRGVALIEIIVAIVLISIMAAVVMSQTAASASGGAAAMVAAEADSVANSYLELIAGRSFVDPNGVDGEALRANFDDVDDYDGVNDVGARDATGASIAGLNALTISVSVRASGALAGVAAIDAKRIDVTVLDRMGLSHLATAYKVRP